MPGIQGRVPAAQCRFVDREAELEALERAYAERPGLLVLYGRRRVGKTRLVAEWLGRARPRAVYYVAQLSSHEHNLAMMAEKAAEQLGDPLVARASPRSLADLLALLARLGAEAVVIDEFTYWARSSPRVLSELQVFVDEELPGTRMLLVLSGSLVGVMERSVLGGGSPLYARARWRLRLGELGFKWLRRLVPRMSSADRVRLYALVGGIPFYLCLASHASSIGEAVDTLLLSPAAPLRDEKDLLLREELRDPHSYSAVLSAIAQGYTTPSRIAEATGIDQSHVHKYLSVLEHLGFVEKRRPLFRKKGGYRVRDPVLRTWYSLLEPVLDLLELGRLEEARREILGRIDEFTAPVWEDLVRMHLLERYAPMGYTEAGFLQHRGEELDVAVLDRRHGRAVVAEAKWSRLSLREAERLRREALAKAHRLLPRGYSVEEAYVAAREVEGERPGWVITPGVLEGEG